MTTVRIFAYGTLITGARCPEVRALLERHLVSRREAFVRGRLYDLGPYPGLVPSPRRSERVHGEVLELRSPERCVAALDDYEDYDPQRPRASTYRREWCRVGLTEGGSAWAWVYWYQGRLNEARRLPDGDWRRWVARLRGGGGQASSGHERQHLRQVAVNKHNGE
jgi:gamma-glutamylcyclotransferase (GGCT)/AIG2-like uncharacterized protein YtfP